MRISPKQLLQSLLYLTPITLLALASCGGGGGGSSTPTLAASYTVGGAASGVQATTAASGLVLRLNGGNDLNVGSGDKSYTFPTAVVANTPYSVTVLKHPTSPVQKCTVANASGTMPNYNVTNANVTCVTAYTVSGTITGLNSNGLILQNNLGDNFLAASGVASYTFSTPVPENNPYSVTVLTEPSSLTCAPTGTPTPSSGTVLTSNITGVTIACITNPTPVVDKFAYAANYGDNTVSAYTINPTTGKLTTIDTVATGSGPYSVAVDSAGTHAYVTNYTSDTVSVFSINSTTGALTAPTSIAAGNGPRAIAIHPSGKFAYVVNYLGNSVSVYRIAANGALSSIDANGATTTYDASIATQVGPSSIAIDPTGSFAYVANAISNTLSVYGIDPTSGALSLIDASSVVGNQASIQTGNVPYAIAINPAGNYLYVANYGDGTISGYTITGNGSLTAMGAAFTAAAGSHSIAVDPNGQYLYVVNTNAATSGTEVLPFSINPTTGTLMAKTGVAAGTSPISISVDSTGHYAYVANSGSADVTAYSISTGVLTRIPCSCGPSGVNPFFPAGNSPYGVVTAK